MEWFSTLTGSQWGLRPRTTKVCAFPTRLQVVYAVASRANYFQTKNTVLKENRVVAGPRWKLFDIKSKIFHLFDDASPSSDFLSFNRCSNPPTPVASPFISKQEFGGFPAAYLGLPCCAVETKGHPVFDRVRKFAFNRCRELSNQLNIVTSAFVDSINDRGAFH